MKESGAAERRTIADMHAEVAATPGAIGHAAIDTIRRCTYVFVGNAMELKAHLESLQDPALALPVMSNAPEYEENGERFDRELVRRLQNFLSAAKSLVDLTRNIVDRMYPEGELRDEYNRLAKDFATNARRRLVQQLRNYVLHNRLPPTSGRLSFTREAEGFAMETRILLDPEQLLRHWKKWDEPVRQLLESGVELDLLELVNEYLDQVAELYLWLYEAQIREHKDDIEATNALIEEFQRQVGQPPEWDPPRSASASGTT